MKRESLSPAQSAKQALRLEIRVRLRAMSAVQCAEASLFICQAAEQWPAFAKAKCVALFSPLPSEPDLRLLVEEAWAGGKRVVFPLMIPRETAPQLDWHEVKAWEQLVERGPWGLLEPDPLNCPRVKLSEIDCAFVPGMAFDRLGFRLGRGGGFYDVFLSHAPETLARSGIMFACQEIAEVPREKHDQVLPGVITEKGFQAF